MKTIFLTGASGRIGRRVVPLLLDRGYRVRVMMRKPPANEPWADRVEIVHGALPGIGTLEAAVSDADAVVHLAALMPPASDDDVFQTNIQGTYQILQAVSALKTKPRLIFASSDATYSTGWSLGAYTAPIEEDDEQHPTVFYGLSKVLGERMCRYFEEMHGLPIVLLRFVWTLEAPEILDLFVKAPYRDFLLEGDRGVWDGDGIIAVPLEEDGAPFTEHLCDVRDAADAVVLALESSAATGQAINIAGPDSFRYADVAGQLASKTGMRPVEARCRGIHSYTLSIEKARSLLGYKPQFDVFKSLEDALALAKG